MFHQSSLFRALPFDNKVVEAVSQLIGERKKYRAFGRGSITFLRPGNR